MRWGRGLALDGDEDRRIAEYEMMSLVIPILKPV